MSSRLRGLHPQSGVYGKAGLSLTRRSGSTEVALMTALLFLLQPGPAPVPLRHVDEPDTSAQSHQVRRRKETVSAMAAPPSSPAAHTTHPADAITSAPASATMPKIAAIAQQGAVTQRAARCAAIHTAASRWMPGTWKPRVRRCAPRPSEARSTTTTRTTDTAISSSPLTGFPPVRLPRSRPAGYGAGHARE